MFKLAVLIGGAKYCMVLSSLVRRGLIDVLRGIALHGTVLSGPVRLSKATFGKAFRGVVSCGGAGSCPAGSSGVWLCKVRRFMARSGCAGRTTVERGFVFHGKVFRGMVWSCDVLFGAVGFIGALYSKVRSYCGVVWSREALHGIVEFGPVKHCVAGHAKALLRSGMVRYGTVRSGFARLRAVGQAQLSLGFVWSGEVGRCIVKRASALFGRVLLGLVKWSPAMFCKVRYSWVWRYQK